MLYDNELRLSLASRDKRCIKPSLLQAAEVLLLRAGTLRFLGCELRKS